MKSAPRYETEDFLDATTAINLRRIWVITLVGTALTLGVLGVELLIAPGRDVTEVSANDLLVSILMIVLVWLVRRRSPTGRWPRVFIAGTAVAWLVSLDAFYFSAFAAASHNASYAIGVMIVAVFFLLPPPVFLPMLGINHVVYCLGLLLLAHDTSRRIAPALIDGTVCMTIAALASWFLYHAAWENFAKERVILERNRALAASNDELREVMAIAAHDLRSPLLDVRNLLALGRREPAANASKTLDGILEQAGAACGRLAQRVSLLVEAHAAENAAATMQPKPLDLRDACQAALQRADATAARKSQRLIASLPPTPAAARLDPMLLERVLDNLLGNALKFSPPASPINVILAPTGSGGWSIAIHDEGPGVPPAERSQLFRKFHRGAARPTGGEDSTGLGLFIAKALAEAMGGDVRYAPREPAGSIFAVELPMSA